MWSAEGIEDGTKGNWENHAAEHGMPGAKSKGVEIPDLPDGVPRVERIKLINHDTGLPLIGLPYIIEYAGKKIEGKTNAKGLTEVIKTPTETELTLHAQLKPTKPDDDHVAYWLDFPEWLVGDGTEENE